MIEIQPMFSPFDGMRRLDADGEFWSAREVQPVMGYSKWQDFQSAIERAKVAALNTGVDMESAFVQVTQLMGAHNLGDLRRYDYRLSRYACYLVAMNGDPRKPEIAAAQTYFAVRTREAETAPAAKPMTELEMAERYVAALRRERELEAQVAELAEDAHHWNTLAVANGDFAVADGGKILSRDAAIQTGERRLFTIMHQYGWIYRGAEGRWRAKQSAVEIGRLTEVPSSHYHPRTGELILDPPTVRITVKGLAELHKRLGGAGDVRDLIEQPVSA